MSQAKKILMIDDDDDLRYALIEQLLIIGEFEVLEAANAQSAIEKTKENDFDLLLLDVGLPDADGRELCKLLRKQGLKCPIIMLTGQDTNILKFLLRSADAIVARDTLLHEVWGYNSNVTTHTLETHIYRLRQKIEPDPARASLLITESGGYKLVALTR